MRARGAGGAGIAGAEGQTKRQGLLGGMNACAAALSFPAAGSCNEHPRRCQLNSAGGREFPLRACAGRPSRSLAFPDHRRPGSPLRQQAWLSTL